MPSFETGTVVAIDEPRPGLLRCRVRLPDGAVDAIAYERLSGSIGVGDRVVVNTTSLELNLGTGGAGFVLWNLDGTAPVDRADGHIMKLRYTALQTEVLAAEAPESPHHDVLAEVETIEDMPVIACSLHSQVAGVAGGFKSSAPTARLGYLMTDGAALPLVLSDLVATLRAVNLIDVTATCGHAFGGELEAINVFSALVALRHAARCDAVVIAMGPGVVGTETRLGFTGMEQGQVLDAASALGGRSVACLRINWSDERERHRGVSHHSLTALRIAARERCIVAVPVLDERAGEAVTASLMQAGLDERHRIVTADGRPGLRLLETVGIEPTSMGRPVAEVPELFLAGSAAGAVAATLLK